MSLEFAEAQHIHLCCDVAAEVEEDAEGGEGRRYQVEDYNTIKNKTKKWNSEL